MSRTRYPDTIGIFDFSVYFSGKGYEECYFYYKDLKLKIYVENNSFYYEIIHVSPIGVHTPKKGSGTFPNCMHEINEWCFLNDHLFLPRK